VDACTNCRVFVGPCSGSVFVRDCTDCKWVLAAQQLRTRGCKRNDFMLYIGAGQPVIEASSELRFGCFQFSYFSLRGTDSPLSLPPPGSRPFITAILTDRLFPSLLPSPLSSRVCAAQFAAARLNVWNSEWCDVFDFSSKADGAGGGAGGGLQAGSGGSGSSGGIPSANWSYLPADTKLSDMLRLNAQGIEKENVSDGNGNGNGGADRVVPLTSGRRVARGAPGAPAAIFVAIVGNNSDIGFELIAKLKEPVRCTRAPPIPTPIMCVDN
jgi:hypothetical protein